MLAGNQPQELDRHPRLSNPEKKILEQFSSLWCCRLHVHLLDLICRISTEYHGIHRLLSAAIRQSACTEGEWYLRTGDCSTPAWRNRFASVDIFGYQTTSHPHYVKTITTYHHRMQRSAEQQPLHYKPRWSFSEIDVQTGEGWLIIGGNGTVTSAEELKQSSYSPELAEHKTDPHSHNQLSN